MIHRTWRRMKTEEATTILSMADCRGQRSPGLLCGRRRDITHTCVRVLHQAEDHTRLPVDIEAQGVLFPGHVDDEVGVSVHWGHNMESIRWGTGWIGWGWPGPRVPLRTHPRSLGWATAGRWSWAELERAARLRAQKLAGEKDWHLEGRRLGPSSETPAIQAGWPEAQEQEGTQSPRCPWGVGAAVGPVCGLAPCLSPSSGTWWGWWPGVGEPGPRQGGYSEDSQGQEEEGSLGQSFPHQASG